jgi:processive 1,2-diacylglycerol beta-glucosyltransferase
MNGKILIITASTGQGHNSVADSLKNELQDKGYEVKCIEPIRESAKMLDKVVSGGYEILATKTPTLFGMLYKASNHRVTSVGLNKIMGSSIKESTYEIIKEYKPSLIISTHPLLVSVISSLKDAGKIDIPFISVVTDYKAHSSYVNSRVDGYIVGSNYTKSSLLEKGVDENRVHTYGIPIKRTFLNVSSSLKQDDMFTILLMGGSMGVKSMKKALMRIMNVDVPIRVIVVCGNNVMLKQELEGIYENIPLDKQLIILGYTQKISELMDVSDVIITKAGGLTITEALNKKLPIIVPYYIPGQEEENVTFLVGEEAALYTELDRLDEVVKELFNNPKKLEAMKENIERIIKDTSLDNTVDLLTSLLAI